MAGPYDSITPESIKQEILADLSGSAETREGSYANTLLSPGAYQIWLAYQMFPQIQMMIFPDASSGEYIDKRAADFGLQRTPGTYAEVGLTFTAYAPTANVVPVGTEDGRRIVRCHAAGRRRRNNSACGGSAHMRRNARRGCIEAETLNTKKPKGDICREKKLGTILVILCHTFLHSLHTCLHFGKR